MVSAMTRTARLCAAAVAAVAAFLILLIAITGNRSSPGFVGSSAGPVSTTTSPISGEPFRPIRPSWADSDPEIAPIHPWGWILSSQGPWDPKTIVETQTGVLFPWHQHQRTVLRRADVPPSATAALLARAITVFHETSLTPDEFLSVLNAHQFSPPNQASVGPSRFPQAWILGIRIGMDLDRDAVLDRNELIASDRLLGIAEACRSGSLRRVDLREVFTF